MAVLDHRGQYARVLHIFDMLAHLDVIKTRLERNILPSPTMAEQMANRFGEWSELCPHVEGGVSLTDAPDMCLDALGTKSN